MVFSTYNADMGLDRCYTSYNERGDEFGNCGHTSTQYLPCSSRFVAIIIVIGGNISTYSETYFLAVHCSDVFCGLRFCMEGTFQGGFSGLSLFTLTVGVFDSGAVRRCRYVQAVE